MVAATAFALRRTAARVVLAFVAGGLVFVVYRALHRVAVHYVTNQPPPDFFNLDFVRPMASPWDLAAAVLGLVAALVAAALLWYGRPVGR